MSNPVVQSLLSRVVVLAPAAVTLAVWTSSRDPYEAAKFAVLVVLAAAAVASWVWSGTKNGHLRAHLSPFTWALGAFLAAGSLTSALGSETLASLFGVPMRQGGLLAYGAAGILGLGAATVAHKGVADRFVLTMMATMVPLGIYGLLQITGNEPLAVTSGVSGVFVTLANPNFAGGVCGSLMGMAVWQVVAGPATWRRVLGGAALVSALVVVVGAASVVGYVSAAASMAVVAAAWLWDRGGRSRTLALPALGAVGAAGAALLAMGFFAAGPLASIGEARGVVLRRFYWEAALSMGGDNVVAGVGFDRFLAFYRGARSQAAANAVDLSLETDAAHSVPLQLFSGGGLLLALAYLGLLAVVGWAFLRVVAQQEGRDRLLVGAVGSVWVGLQAQSLASFDLPATLTLSLVTGGLLAGLAWPGATRSIPLPAVTVAPAPTGRPGKRQKARAKSVALPAWLTPVAGTLAAVVLLVGLVVGTRPFLAESASGAALRAEAAGDFVSAAVEWERAAGTAPWEADYAYRHGLALLRAGSTEAAIAALDEALGLRPDHVGALVSKARAFGALGRDEEAGDVYRLALTAEPHHLDLKVEAARALLRTDPVAAEQLIEQIESVDPAHVELDNLRALLESVRG